MYRLPICELNLGLRCAVEVSVWLLQLLELSAALAQVLSDAKVDRKAIDEVRGPGNRDSVCRALSLLRRSERRSSLPGNAACARGCRHVLALFE